MDYIDTWGLYQCFQGTDDEMVASDCREDFFSLQPNGKVFQCISSHEGMITLMPTSSSVCPVHLPL